MTREEVISKVKKLFALSTSSNENEAALAAAKAREFLSAHNLSIADLPVDKQSAGIDITEESITIGKTMPTWQKLVAAACRKLCDCQTIRYPGRVMFIGTEMDVTVAGYTFTYLCGEVNRLTKQALPDLKKIAYTGSRTAARSYREGAATRIFRMVQDHLKSIRRAEAACDALVVIKDQKIKDYIGSTYGRLKTTRINRSYGSTSAFDRGYGDAESVSLRPGVSARHQQAINQ